MASCDAQELLELSKCFGCLDNKQLMMVRAALLCKILQATDPMASCDVNDLMDSAKCFDCLDTHKMQMIQVQLLCEILAVGGGGASCLLCGAAEPTDAPSCDCALYYKTPEGYWYHWDAGAARWVQDIGGP